MNRLHRIGLLVPSTNTTVEADFQRLAAGVASFHSQRMRASNGDMTAAMLEAMNEQLSAEASCLCSAEVDVCFVDRALSEALVHATRAFDSTLAILVVPATELERTTELAGMRAVRTFLADRAYDEKGRLVSRQVRGSLIEDLDEIAERIVRMITEKKIRTIEGKLLTMSHESILVHGDTPRAVEIARTVRATIERLGARVTSLSKMGIQVE